MAEKSKQLKTVNREELIHIKNVLWVSRHEMTKDQFFDLERVMGDTVKLSVFCNTVTDVEELSKAIKNADAVAVVLPPEMLGKVLVLAGQRPVLRTIADRQPTGRVITLADGRQEAEFSFIHKGWERILKADFQTQRL